MPDDPNNTPSDSDSSWENPPLEEGEVPFEEYLKEQGTVTGEGETQPEGEAEPEAESESEGGEDWEARYKALQSEYTTTSQERAELRNHVKELVAASAKSVQGGATQETDINKIAEDLAKTKGAGAAIDEIASARVQQIVGPLMQQIQELKVQASNPDYAKLKPRVDKILADASEGKVDIDTLITRVARAEDFMETARKTGSVPRKPDSPSRGAMLGGKGRSAGAEAINPETASDLDLQRAVLRTITNPDERVMFLERHPGLRGKGS